MSSTVGLGVPVPKMLPVAGTWTLPFTAYLLLLGTRVMYRRVKTEKYIGDAGDDKPDAKGKKIDPLALDSRCHANFVENVPLAFVLVAIAELNGGNRTVLNYAMATLFAFRIAHVELGLRSGDQALGVGRPLGFFGTQGFLAGMAAYGTWLVKGYWGY